MKNARLSISILVHVLILILSFSAWSQSKGGTKSASAGQMTNELFDVRNKLENEIQKNLTNLIGTQLNPETFTVAVRVKVVMVPPSEPKPEDKKNEEELPAGLDLGIISARELAAAYERQIEEIKLKKDLLKEKEKTQFQVTKMEIIVGLESTYGEPYINQFKKWLAEKVKKDYGNLATSSVTKLPEKFVPPKETPLPEDPFQPKYLSVPVAAGLVALALILLGLLLWSGLHKLASANKPIELKQDGQLRIEGALGNADMLEDEADDPSANAPIQRLENLNYGEDIDRMIKKIAFVAIELGSRINELVRIWLDHGDLGFTKTALLVDTILTAQEKIMVEAGKIAPLKIPLSQEVAKQYEEKLANSYKTLSELSPSDKLNLLEKIYWDLISLQTLGVQSLRRPFDFLNGMTPENILNLLAVQPTDARALAIMHLPYEAKTQVLDFLSDDDRDEVVEKALINSQIPDRQIWDIDTAMKVTLLNQASDPADRLVNLFPRTIELLKSLNIVEEIRILRKVCPGLENGGLLVKQQFNTLAFIDEWKSEYIAKLVGVATADELVTLIRLIPEAKDPLFDVVAPTVRTIIKDDLKLAAPKDSSVLQTKLTTLKKRWNKIASNEKIAMSKVISASDNGSEVWRAAG